MVDAKTPERSGEIRSFQFNDQQFKYLRRNSGPRKEMPGEWNTGTQTVRLSKVQYDDWLQELTDRLIGFGFTAALEPTPEAMIIESIIDVLTEAAG